MKLSRGSVQKTIKIPSDVWDDIEEIAKGIDLPSEHSLFIYLIKEGIKRHNEPYIEASQEPEKAEQTESETKKEEPEKEKKQEETTYSFFPAGTELNF